MKAHGMELRMLCILTWLRAIRADFKVFILRQTFKNRNVIFSTLFICFMMLQLSVSDACLRCRRKYCVLILLQGLVTDQLLARPSSLKTLIFEEEVNITSMF